MRYILAIDTAGADGSVALAGDGVGLSVEVLPPGGHSEGLTSAAARVLESHGLTIGDLAAVAASRGPGSFTGLRIGLAWAKGAAWGRSLPLVLVSTHEALARGHARSGSMVATLIPGERGRVEAALWENGTSTGPIWGPEQVEEESVIERVSEAARARSPGMAAAPLLAPLSAPRLRELLEGDADQTPFAWSSPVLLAPAVAEIADRLFLAGKTADWADAAPSYSRAPNARKPSS